MHKNGTADMALRRKRRVEHNRDISETKDISYKNCSDLSRALINNSLLFHSTSSLHIDR